MTHVKQEPTKIDEVGDVTRVRLLPKKLLAEDLVDRVGGDLIALAGKKQKIAVDCSAVEWMSSRMLGHWLDANKKKGCRVVFYGICDAIFEVFVISKLDKQLTCRKTEGEALAALT
ncbi:hypothetical protein HZA45_02205 [Candidatus Peregrinibacteria bacterium]|nr:hypothetical protein [Candidatus Peregrinibacteria bacterium]